MGVHHLIVASRPSYAGFTMRVSNETLKVLVVDDDRLQRMLARAALESLGHQVIECVDGHEALRRFTEQRPDVVLLDVEMPEHDGYWVAQQLRAAEPGGWTPILFLSGLQGDEEIWRGIEAGGDDFLSKPVTTRLLGAKLRAMQRLLTMRRKLEERSEELRQANTQLEELSTHDALTGLANRRALDAHLHHEIAACRREGQALSVALLDIDHFKRFNDRAGHLAGDECLRRVSQLLHDACLRPRDLAGRYGGEEFALILPLTPVSGAMTYARGLLRLLAQMQIPHPDSPVGAWLTLSGGITTCVPDDSTTAEGLLLRADDALYQAKAKGRNRFFSYEMKLDTLERGGQR
jgi:diguanylate cyclase (GGDEF)-like protein